MLFIFSYQQITAIEQLLINPLNDCLLPVITQKPAI